ncbi:MAG: hypothetical protein AB3N63_08740 [Puniceicoccaceae bacterium]
MAQPVANSNNSGMDPARDFFFRLGSEVAAPLMTGLVRWMAAKLREARPDIILFLSRDGDILHKLWEKHCPDELADIPTRYLLASRRALRLASLRKVDESFCKFMTSQATGLSIRQMFQRIGLEEAAFLPVLSRNTRLAADLPWSRDLEREVHDTLKVLEPDLLRLAEREREAYCRYLDSEGINMTGRLAVVDVGWHASLQLALAEILRSRGQKLQTDGYYCGIFPDAIAGQTDDDQFHGYLLEGNQPAGRFSEVHRFVEIIEFLFSSAEKSLLYFKEGEDGIPSAVFCPDSASNYQLDAIRAMQEGCLTYADDPSRYPDDPYPALKRLGLDPTIEEASFLAPLEAARGFGDIRHLQGFARTGSQLGNLVRWKRFYSDFKDALWRPGFWARLSPMERKLLKLLSPDGTKGFK